MTVAESSFSTLLSDLIPVQRMRSTTKARANRDWSRRGYAMDATREALHIDTPMAPPARALLVRELLRAQALAVKEFCQPLHR